MADTKDLKSFEVKPHEGSSPSSGMSDELWNFLRSENIRLKVYVDTRNPGYEGHPIALANFIKFLYRLGKYESKSNEENS